MVIHKEFISNAREFESYLVVGQPGCACVAMGDQHYNFYSHIAFVPPIKPGLSLTYPLNPMHRNIATADRKYQKKLHDYHLVKNMNRAFNKIVVASI